ncbi:DUF6986 family protein [Rhizohabitans arisaemae]|uniref:DUF6986 family protein n=1 Tax=Rhizohabitans arisaemae TaxID=2720610 RepID=UPI0024B143F8|nr:aldolase/citrate lyase family protein [Rhizohabitans arisaemae]
MRTTLGATHHHRQTPEPPAGQPAGRQPVHTVYIPADRFDAGTVSELGTAAARLLDTRFDAEALGLTSDDQAFAGLVRSRVAAKLAAEPVEDVRIDFEDGYGVRPDGQEDADVGRAVEAVAAMAAGKTLPRRWGLRIKSFADGHADRALRTLDGFLTGIADATGGLPEGFTVTFPKVTRAEYLDEFERFLEALERSLGLPDGTLRFEMQVETTQTVMFLLAGRGRTPRLAAAHFGVFDYTASCGLPPEEQRLDHPACDFARHVMQVAFAGTGVELSDGSTNLVPASEAAADVHAVWRTHSALVRHSLSHGFHQGWDMHPAHLVSRFATVYAFHLARQAGYTARVSAYQEQAEQSGLLEEPATIRALSAILRRGTDCGAF